MAIGQKTDNVGLGTSTALSPEEEKKKKEEEQQQLSQPSQTPISSTQAPSTPQTVTAMPKQQKAGTGTFANLRSYIQAAQGGGQQKIAGAALQRLQSTSTGAKKGLEQAQKTFETQREAGSLENMGTAQEEATNIIGSARRVTAAPTQTATQPQVSTQGVTTSEPTQVIEPNQETEVIPPTTTFPDYLAAEEMQRFGDIVNAQYQGPMSLQQAGLYQDPYTKARVAEEAGKLAQTAQGRELLLRDIFGRDRDYTRGQSKLDALLLNMAQPEVVKVQEQAKTNLEAMRQAQAAQNLSSNLAAQRIKELEDIRSGVRGEFSTQSQEERDLIDKAIEGVISSSKDLTDYFNEALANKGNEPVYLSKTEALTLGIDSGEGLYNINPKDMWKLNELRNEKLITRDEQARLQALAQLAGLAKEKDISTTFFDPYRDASLAGTQNVFTALNTEGWREALNKEEQDFIKEAKAANITGRGKGTESYKRGWGRGRKWVSADATLSENIGDLLESSGYEMSPEAKTILTDENIQKKLAEGFKQGFSEEEILSNLAQEAISMSVPEEFYDKSEITPVDSGTSYTGDKEFNFSNQAVSDFLSELGENVLPDLKGSEYLSAYTLPLKLFPAGVDAARGVLDALSFGGDYGSNIIGTSKSAAKRRAKKEAQVNAAKDLGNKIQAYFTEKQANRRSQIVGSPEEIQNLQDEYVNQYETATKNVQDYQNQIKTKNSLVSEVKNKYNLSDKDLTPENLDQTILEIQRKQDMWRADPNSIFAVNPYTEQLNSLKKLQPYMSEDFNSKLEEQQAALANLEEQKPYLDALAKGSESIEARRAGLEGILSGADLRNIG